MFAFYRKRLMDSLNAYFQMHNQGDMKELISSNQKKRLKIILFSFFKNDDGGFMNLEFSFRLRRSY